MKHNVCTIKNETSLNGLQNLGIRLALYFEIKKEAKKFLRTLFMINLLKIK